MKFIASLMTVFLVPDPRFALEMDRAAIVRDMAAPALMACEALSSRPVFEKQTEAFAPRQEVNGFLADAGAAGLLGRPGSGDDGLRGIKIRRHALDITIEIQAPRTLNLYPRVVVSFPSTRYPPPVVGHTRKGNIWTFSLSPRSLLFAAGTKTGQVHIDNHQAQKVIISFDHTGLKVSVVNDTKLLDRHFATAA